MLIDTRKKLLYIGQAGNLVDRLRQDHASIRDWNYFRYDVLPAEVEPHRKAFERMLICDFCTLLKRLPNEEKIRYKLVNTRIDTFAGP
jgi:hypothetical protein